MIKNRELDTELNECFNNRNALVIVALMFLSSNKKTLIPELMTFFQIEDLKKFMFMYGGLTITIPTPKEFEFNLTCAISAYYKVVKKQKWTWIQKKLDIDDDSQFLKIQRSCENWIRGSSEADMAFLKNIRDIGDIL